MQIQYLLHGHSVSMSYLHGHGHMQNINIANRIVGFVCFIWLYITARILEKKYPCLECEFNVLNHSQLLLPICFPHFYKVILNNFHFE